MEHGAHVGSSCMHGPTVQPHLMSLKKETGSTSSTDGAVGSLGSSVTASLTAVVVVVVTIMALRPSVLAEE